jgi:hypothetical protein
MRLKLTIILFFLCSFFTFSDEFPSVRYVTAKPGVNKRQNPSISSNLAGTPLLYGLRIVAHERSDNMDTIDEITDYWYKCSGGYIGVGGGKYWVFGGYLSTTIPDDTPSVLGVWDTDHVERNFWWFSAEYAFYSGKIENGHIMGAWMGTWTLSENKLTIAKTSMELPDYQEHMIIEINVTVITRDRIILSFPNGDREILTRNNDP